MKPIREALVIGAGPCGIAAVGRLIDLSVKVTWIDPYFNVGRMGERYRNVPANTPTGDLVDAMNLCESFDFIQTQALRRSEYGGAVMLDLERSHCHDLRYFVEALEDATKILVRRCEKVVRGRAVSLCQTESRSWTAVLTEEGEGVQQTHSITTDAVIYSPGAVPRLPLPKHANVESADSGSGEGKVRRRSGTVVHEMDEMVDPVFIAELVRSRPEIRASVWGVVGGSHSAMLIVKNLIECGVERVVNIYRSEIKYQHIVQPGGWFRYRGSGLKGPVGDWTQSNITNERLTRVRYEEGKPWSQLIEENAIDNAVFAMGFESLTYGSQTPTVTIRESGSNDRLTMRELSQEQLFTYDSFTGEIYERGSNLFGLGIAYPQDYVDGGGNVEPWVGFKRAIEQVDLMVMHPLEHESPGSTEKGDERNRRLDTFQAACKQYLEPITFKVEGGSLYGSISQAGSRGILLVHGLASNRRMYDECAMHLADLGYHVLSLDMRGHGESRDVQTPDLSMDAFSDDLASVLLYLRENKGSAWDKPVVVGQSWGGNLVLNLARRFSSLDQSTVSHVAGVVCIDGGFIDLQERYPDWKDCERALMPPDLKIPANELAEELRSWRPKWSSFGIEGMLGNFSVDIPNNSSYLRLDLEKHMALLRDLWERRPREGLGDLSTPVLFIPVGSIDGDAFSSDKERDIQSLTEVLGRNGGLFEVHWFRDSCHDVHTECPVEVSQAIHEQIQCGIFALSTS